MKIENTEPRLHKVANLFTLMPGVQQVDEADFREAMRLRPFASLVDEGKIVVVDANPTDDLSCVGAKQAVKLVGRTVDRDLLSKWLAAEKRQDVQRAIAAQLNALKVDAQNEKSKGKDEKSGKSK